MKIFQLPWLFLIPFFTALFGINTILVSSQCLEGQKSLLLQLKNSLKFNSAISVSLVNWTQTNDCCGWKGVNCDPNGRVTGLDLNSESISGGINQSSLFSLQFLENLNLANNSFKFAQIPPSFGNLTSLRYLNLSMAGFNGQIPIELSLLTRLAVLDLSSLYFPGTPSLQLENPNLLTLLRNLNKLTELHLDGVNISAKGSGWSQAISSSLPSLRVLSLSNCYLSGPIDISLQNLQFLSEINLGKNNLSAPVPEFFASFPNLTALSLSSSNLYGTFPEKILRVPTLQTLDLENNRLVDGSLPEFPRNSNLKKLVLSDTKFSGRLPDSMGNLTKLSWIEIARCNFSGMIPTSMANLTQLVYVDMSSNMFNGPIPSFQMSKNLSYIDISHSNLTGPVPDTHFEGLSNLVNINLAYNSFKGSVPSSLFSLPSLKKIQLSNNHFDEVSQSPNRSSPELSPLDTLDLSSNKLQGPIPPYFFDFVSISIFSLSFNNFSGIIQLESIRRIPSSTQLQSFSETSFEGNERLCGPPLNTSCSNPSTPPSVNKSDSVLRTVFDWQFIYTGLGFGIGAGFIVGPLMFWKKLSNCCDEHIERFVWKILPTLGFIFPCCNDVNDEAEDNIDEVPLTEDSDEDDDEMEDKTFMGRYCVFCSKLDIYRKKVIHDPKCCCHELPPISSSSTSSSSPSK
ncbi:inactive leucine-rich repeat receptor-like protein kinase [Actinidia chinensis var. chinensis]|uniref:Inactive leucine-rich repeat receptor-like protein kinase n=1 Tax=Actinidia chinensis var. chinensis TaxID=1590841 RepID=A0A2R6RXD9_ACTCC|nr:inactive leucine-rich repeat receptor-like protein kinase [Actinidia chinensis var. chinensis]